MSTYTQKQQTEIVEDAMKLTAAIIYEKGELAKLNSERFRSMPEPPVRKVLEKPKPIKPSYPKAPKTNYSYFDYLKKQITEFLEKHKKHVRLLGIALAAFLVLGIVISIISEKISMMHIFSIVTGILSIPFTLITPVVIVTFIDYLKKRKSINDKLSQSPQYLKAVKDAEILAEKQQKEADEKFQKDQADLDAKYQAEKDHYDNQVVPEYNREKTVWSEMQKKKIEVVESDLKVNSETLEELYTVTKLISPTYREISLLSWLYNDMSSTDHDIKYATELLDRERQRDATFEVGSAVRDMDRSMQQGLGAVYAAIEEGNELQYETLLETKKLRRWQQADTIAGTYQRHKTNKHLESANQHLDSANQHLESLNTRTNEQLGAANKQLDSISKMLKNKK